MNNARDKLTAFVLGLLFAAIVYDCGRQPEKLAESAGARKLDLPKPVEMVTVNAFTYFYPDYNLATAKTLPFTVERKR